MAATATFARMYVCVCTYICLSVHIVYCTYSMHGKYYIEVQSAYNNTNVVYPNTVAYSKRSHIRCPYSPHWSCRDAHAGCHSAVARRRSLAAFIFARVCLLIRNTTTNRTALYSTCAGSSVFYMSVCVCVCAFVQHTCLCDVCVDVPFFVYGIHDQIHLQHMSAGCELHTLKLTTHGRGRTAWNVAPVPPPPATTFRPTTTTISPSTTTIYAAYVCECVMRVLCACTCRRVRSSNR